MNPSQHSKDSVWQFMRRRAALSLVEDAGWVWLKGCVLFAVLCGLFLGGGGWLVGAIAPVAALPGFVLFIFLALLLHKLPLPPVLKWPLFALVCFSATAAYVIMVFSTEGGNSDPTIDIFKESEEPILICSGTAASALSLLWQYFLPGFRLRIYQ